MSGPDGEPLRIGILGAARITSLSLVEPARTTGHRLVAVAARSAERAAAFAEEHGIERVHDTYADVLADPEVEAVYNPHEDDTLTWRRPGHDDAVEHLGRRTSYTFQLEAFAAAVRRGAPVVTDVDFTVATMQMVDGAYQLAGMEPRRPAA